MQLAAHLSFNGNCREAFEFYARTFNGTHLTQLTYGEAPPGGSNAAQMRDRIMHAHLEIEGQSLMGADAPPGHYHPSRGMMLSVSIEEVGRAQRIFETLARDGQVNMPFQETFWAQGFGMCIDRFGTPWMVNCANSSGASANATQARTTANATA